MRSCKLKSNKKVFEKWHIEQDKLRALSKNQETLCSLCLLFVYSLLHMDYLICPFGFHMSFEQNPYDFPLNKNPGSAGSFWRWRSSSGAGAKGHRWRKAGRRATHRYHLIYVVEFNRLVSGWKGVQLTTTKHNLSGTYVRSSDTTGVILLKMLIPAWSYCT